MKKIYVYFLAASITLAFFPASSSLAKGQKSSLSGVEIFIQGKKYRSIRDYRREQIKTAFEGVLSSRDLNEFSEDELITIIKEIRKPKTAASPPEEDSGGPSQATIKEDAQDLSTLQMQKMLQNYLNEHQDIDPIVVNPDKVKNVIIGD